MAISDKLAKQLKELGLEEVIAKLNEIESQREAYGKIKIKVEDAIHKLEKEPLAFWAKEIGEETRKISRKIIESELSIHKESFQKARKEAKDLVQELQLERDKLQHAADDIGKKRKALLTELVTREEYTNKIIDAQFEKVVSKFDEGTIVGRFYKFLTKRWVVPTISIAALAGVVGLSVYNSIVLGQIKQTRLGNIEARVKVVELSKDSQKKKLDGLSAEYNTYKDKTDKSVKENADATKTLQASNIKITSDFDTFKQGFDKLKEDAQKSIDDKVGAAEGELEAAAKDAADRTDALTKETKEKNDALATEAKTKIEDYIKTVNKTLADNDLKYTKAFGDVAGLIQKADALQKAYDANQTASKAERTAIAKQTEELTSSLVAILETNSKLISSDIESAEKLSKETIDYMKTAFARNPETEKYSKQLNALKSSQESLESAYSDYKKQVVKKIDALGDLTYKEHSQKELTNLSKQIGEGMANSRKPVEEYEAKTKPLLEELAKAAKTDSSLQREYNLLKQQSEDIAKKHKALYETSETRYKGIVLLIKQKEIK